ncbi:MAG: sirohydrochlorin cobaltochelatase, partial [Desulfovibrio sp.]|nr:sirohydrochlorin cobaltochelatase [Desulfovibrio sp.]
MPRSRVLSCLLISILFCMGLNACAHRTATTSEAPHEGVLLVAFGTSVPEAMESMHDVDAAFKAAFPNQPVVWAYTSQIIRKKLAAEGRPVGGISDGLTKLADKGVRVVRVQSLHVMAGEEFSALERALLLDVKQHPQRFDAVFLGRPMLESREDAKALATAVLEDTKKLRPKGEALVLMGHGQEQGRAGLTFEGARTVFHDADRKVFMATVEGAHGFDELLTELKAAKIKKAILEPMMLVAGDHARNDLAGDEDDSWASQLSKAGIKTEAHLKGLGQIA